MIDYFKYKDYSNESIALCKEVGFQILTYFKIYISAIESPLRKEYDNRGESEENSYNLCQAQ